MRLTKEDFAEVAAGLKQVKASTAQLTAAISRTRREARIAGLRSSSQTGTASESSRGNCSQSGSGKGSPANGVLAKAFASGLGSAIRYGIRNDFAAALRSMASALTRSLASAVGRSAGGGLGGSLASSLIGGGISALLGGLFRRRQRVQVDNTIKAEVLNFPRYTSLDFAANPASRLFGNRAVPHGPAFNVSVEYRDGAEDFVTAKVAAKLAEANFNEGVG